MGRVRFDIGPHILEDVLHGGSPVNDDANVALCEKPMSRPSTESAVAKSPTRRIERWQLSRNVCAGAARNRATLRLTKQSLVQQPDDDFALAFGLESTAPIGTRPCTGVIKSKESDYD
jgi:hypothetical protein